MNQLSLIIILNNAELSRSNISEMDLSGIDFAEINDLGPLYAMDDLTDLWLVNTQNMDATGLDVMIDNLETIEETATEGILYMMQADYDSFNLAGNGLLEIWHNEQGHHVEFVIPEPSSIILLLAACCLSRCRGRAV